MKETNFNLKDLTFCGVCVETPKKFQECVAFESVMKIEGQYSQNKLTYLDCFELVTHLKIDLNIASQLYLCSDCCSALHNSFLFLRKAERSQKLLYEKIELEQKENRHDLDINDLIEEIVSDDEFCSTPVAMFITNSTEDLELHDLNEVEILHSEQNSDNDIEASVFYDNCDVASPNDTQLELSSVTTEDDSIMLALSEHDETLSDQEEEEEELNCNICSKTFRTPTLLNIHLGYHRRKINCLQLAACTICKKTYSTKYYLRQHMELVHAEKRQELKCDQCSKIYFSKASLHNHKRLHNGKTVSCTECNKVFLNQYDLKIHMRFHSQNYPFICTVCQRKFAIKSHLRAHMWQHEGLKLQCTEENCRKLFTSTKALLDHSFVHANEMPYPCIYCKKSYPSKQKYKLHLFMVHKVEFDEIEHTKASKVSKSFPHKKKFNLVQTKNIMEEAEIESNIEKQTESLDDMVLEVG